jgi:hypothetical protein
MIYLASPYSHDDITVRDARYRAARNACAVLARAGEHVISPIVHWHCAAFMYDLPTDALYWRAQNHATIDACECVYVLTIEGWRDSLGVQDEIRYAGEHGIPVYLFDGVTKGEPIAFAGAPTGAAAVSADRAPGAKHDAGTRRYDLVPWGAIGQMVDVLGHGAAKYSADGWRAVPDARRRYFAALMRHVIAWYCGERTDPDSGMHHLAHALCDVAFLIEGEPK